MITLWSKITITWNEFIAEFWHLCFTDGLPQLIFTNGGDVMMADIHGRFVRTLVPAQGKGYAIGVATHWNSGKVFWSDIDTNKVSLDHCLGTFLISLLCECQPCRYSSAVITSALEQLQCICFFKAAQGVGFIPNSFILLPGIFCQLQRGWHQGGSDDCSPPCPESRCGLDQLQTLCLRDQDGAYRHVQLRWRWSGHAGGWKPAESSWPRPGPYSRVGLNSAGFLLYCGSDLIFFNFKKWNLKQCGKDWHWVCSATCLLVVIIN